VLQCIAMCCSVLLIVAVCCCELQFVAVCCSVLQCDIVGMILGWDEVILGWDDVLQCAAECCYAFLCVSQCVAA